MRLNPERRELAIDGVQELTESDLDAVSGGAACSPCEEFFGWRLTSMVETYTPNLILHESTHAQG